MNIRTFAGTACCAGALALASCRETRTAPRLAREAAGGTSEVLLTVSDSMPSVGDTVRVTAVLRLRGDTVAASFTARLHFDPAALACLGDLPLADGALRASKLAERELRIAGASVPGFASGALFSAAFTVRQPGALHSLHVTFDELHELHARDIVSSVRAGGRVVQGGDRP